MKTVTLLKNRKTGNFHWVLLTYKRKISLFYLLSRGFYQFTAKIFSKHKEEIKKHQHVFLLKSMYLSADMYTQIVIQQKST